MADARRDDTLRHGTAEIVYRLSERASPAVTVGETVNTGEVIAAIPAPPTVVAIADALRLSVSESSGTIASLDGATLTEGQIVVSRRSGLRKRAIRAPTGGTVRTLLASGALLIERTDGPQAIRALHRGRVIAVERDAVTLETDVYRTWFAFIAGTAWQCATLPDAADSAERKFGRTAGRVGDSAGAASIVAYIDDASALAPERDRASDPIIIGTASDEAAWALLTRAGGTHDREIPARPVVVLRGPGDAAQGERAIRPLLGLTGALIAIDRFARAIIVFPDDKYDLSAEDGTDEESVKAAVYVDPGHWQQACIVAGAPYVSTLETGARTLVVRTARGNDVDERTPLVNLDLGAIR